MYRYILRESRSQFDSLPLTSLTKLADVVVFLDLSMSFFGYHGHLWLNLPLLGWTLVLCLVGRAAHVLPISMCFGLPCVKKHQSDRQGISLRNQAMIWFSGLRGAIACVFVWPAAHARRAPTLAPRPPPPSRPAARMLFISFLLFASSFVCSSFLFDVCEGMRCASSSPE